jgi:hypothetical protein
MRGKLWFRFVVRPLVTQQTRHGAVALAGVIEFRKIDAFHRVVRHGIFRQRFERAFTFLFLLNLIRASGQKTDDQKTKNRQRN